MPTRNLRRLTYAANTIQAREDWRKLADFAEARGHVDLVEQFTPPAYAGWKRIDRCIARLREALRGRDVEDLDDA